MDILQCRMAVGMAVVGNSKNLYDSALWLRTFKDATTKNTLGGKEFERRHIKGIAMHTGMYFHPQVNLNVDFSYKSINGNLMNPL